MELDDATKNLAEAKIVLDPEVRKKMKADSHLGELTDLIVLKQGADKVEKWLPVLKGYHPTNNTFDGLPDMFKKELAKFSPKPKPKIVEKEEEIEPEIQKITEGIAIGEGVKALEEEMKKESISSPKPVETKKPRLRPSKRGRR